MSAKIYSVRRHIADELVEHLHNWLSWECKAQTQKVNIDENRTVIQVNVFGNMLGRMTGAARVINILIVKVQDCVKVDAEVHEEAGCLWGAVSGVFGSIAGDSKVLLLAHKIEEEIEAYMS